MQDKLSQTNFHSAQSALAIAGPWISNPSDQAAEYAGWILLANNSQGGWVEKLSRGSPFANIATEIQRYNESRRLRVRGNPDPTTAYKHGGGGGPPLMYPTAPVLHICWDAGCFLPARPPVTRTFVFLFCFVFQSVVKYSKRVRL